MLRPTNLLLLLTVLGSNSAGEVVELQPAKDVTLYESATQQLANGAGSVFVVGRTGRSSDPSRRALLQFDLTELPGDVAVTDVELSVTVSRAPSSETFPIGLHRVFTGWGEGGSDAAAVGDGQGIAATDGDATWTHAVFPDLLWETPGGDIATLPSASTLVGDVGSYDWSSVDMVNDVNQWLLEPESNFGWLLLGDETEPMSARRMNSRSNMDASTRPTLRIEFDVGLPIPGDCNDDGILDVNDLRCVCADETLSLESTLDALNLVVGDMDASGSVEFADFLTLAANFGQDGEYVDGDLNCSGTVGFPDFLVLAANFGSSSQLMSVPEPNSVCHVLCGLFPICLRSFRRRFGNDAAIANAPLARHPSLKSRRCPKKNMRIYEESTYLLYLRLCELLLARTRLVSRPRLCGANTARLAFRLSFNRPES